MFDPITLNPVVSPCKKCEERFVGCHGVCEKYDKYKQETERNRKEAILKHPYCTDVKSYYNTRTKF